MTDYLHGLLDVDRNRVTSTGRRTHNPLHNWVETRAARFKPTPGFNRFEAINLLKSHGLRIPVNEHGAKWTERLILHIDLLVKFTMEKDWQAGQAIVWMSVDETATRLGISTKQVSRQEKQLLKLGVLFWNDAGNRRRTGERDQNGNVIFAFGVNITALGTMLDDLREAKKKIDRDHCERKASKKILSGLRQECRTVFDFAFANNQAQSKTYTKIMEITEQAKKFLTERIRYNTGIDYINFYIHELRCALNRLKKILHPSQSAPDSQESSEACGQTCVYTEEDAQKEAKKDQLGDPESVQLAPPKRGDTCKNTKPKAKIYSSTSSTTEREEPSPQATQEPDVVEDCHKGEEEPTEDPPILQRGKPTNPIQRSAEKQKERDRMMKNRDERYDPRQVRKHIDLGRLQPHVPSFIRHQWDGSWSGLYYYAKIWKDDLGLSNKMIQEATSIMGTEALVIAILITHWKNELGLIDRTPAAYLWGMIRKAKSGNMNLPKTIYSLQNRNKYQ